MITRQGSSNLSSDNQRLAGSVCRRLFVVALAGILVAALLIVSPRPASAAGEPIIAGELRLTPTLDHIGVVWSVQGDTNLNSTMVVQFRRSGESTWRPGAPAMRAEPSVVVDGSPLGINSWAASAMFLERGTSYEIQATISDPDGGGATQIAQAATRTMLQPGPNQRYVVPGSGGGSGTEADPFQGLQAAADSASAGDTLVVASGVYSSFVLSASGTAANPISIISADGADAIIDGAGTDRGVVTLESTSHVIISGLTIRNGGWGIDAQHTQQIVISNNTITDVDFGVYNRRDADRERYQVVCDNIIEGRTAWPGTGIPGERGIDLRGWGNTICNNTVSDFGDCISMQPMTGPSYGNDIFGNDSSRCVDDGIEIDFNQANARVYRNRVTNARMGISVQPIYGGPAYILRNELFNLESSTIKLNNQPSGLFIAHNTGIKLDNALQAGGVFNNTVLRNNLFIGTRYAFEFVLANPGGRNDFNFNAWGSLRTGNWFKWDNVRYAGIADLPAGVEDDGIAVGLGAVISADLPAAWNIQVPAGSQDLRPSPGSAVVGAGTAIANINEPFVTDGAPDAGAFEAGTAVARYGPGTPLIVGLTSVTPTPTAVTPTPTTALCGGRQITIDMSSNGGNGEGTPGADVILGTAGNDVISASGGDDVICSGSGDDQIDAGDGADWVRAGAGNDIVNGGPGNDKLFGITGDDTINGGPGDDIIHGNKGNDTLAGNAGSDRIFGYANDDVINGGPGNDRLHGNFGEDALDGGSGNDTIFGYGDNDLILGGVGNDTINGNRGNDTLNGNEDDDQIKGADGDDVIDGGQGNDVLFGNSLNDTITGGIGDDIIDGGTGVDSCIGGPGTDTATRCESGN